MPAGLRIDDTAVLGSDAAPDAYEAPKGFAMMLDPEEPERLFAALAQNGTVNMPLQQRFRAQRFGAVIAVPR